MATAPTCGSLLNNYGVVNTAVFVSELRKRNVSAFEYLYTNYSAALLGRISRVVKDPETSKDILQNTFIKIWRNIDHYDLNKARLFTWMLAICRNEIVDHFRYTTSKKRTLTEIFVRQNFNSSFQGPDYLLDTTRLFAKLNPKDRVLVELIYLHGFTHLQTSALLNLPLGTVKTKIRALIIKLREAAAA